MQKSSNLFLFKMDQKGPSIDDLPIKCVAFHSYVKVPGTKVRFPVAKNGINSDGAMNQTLTNRKMVIQLGHMGYICDQQYGFEHAIYQSWGRNGAETQLQYFLPSRFSWVYIYIWREKESQIPSLFCHPKSSRTWHAVLMVL